MTAGEFWARLTSLFRKRDLDREFDDELAAHIDLATEEHLRQGMPPAEARRQAIVKLGGIQAAKQLHRESRGLAWLESLFYDLRHAVRTLLRERHFTLTAVVILAIAIGLNTTVFAVRDSILFRGFPMVKRNDRLLYMQERNPWHTCCISYLDFEDWR